MITGATGFLGKVTLVRLLKQDEFLRIYVLVRKDAKNSACERVEKLVDDIAPPELRKLWADRIYPIEGDLLLPNLGISALQREELCRSLQQILHIGASTNFGDPIEVAREYNVEGTRKVLELAKECKLKGSFERFDYVSTAYVAGTLKGVVTEEDLDRGQSFSNSYEQSKFEAELLVQSYRVEFPVSVYRPSIIVGDSHNGYTPHFKVLYWPLKLLSKPAVSFCFVNKRTRLDVVPIDYVVKALVALIANPLSRNQTFHLTAGIGSEISSRQLLEDAFMFAQIPRKKIFPMWIKNLLQKTFLQRFLSTEMCEVLTLIEPYNSYFDGIKVRFCNKKTEEFLRPMGFHRPAWKDMAEVILGFCVLSRWGRKLPQKEYLYYVMI